jgi:hypothetical protein
VVFAGILAMLVATSASADFGNGYIAWPTLLPGRQVGPAAPPKGLPGCRHLKVACVKRLVRRLHAEWKAEDATCDHHAIFSIAYERISHEIQRRLRGHQTFEYPRWFISVVQGFSNEYFQTLRRYDAGKSVPGAWRIYYEETASGDANAGQDLLLASNAHTNHDLPYAYAAAGLLTRGGVSRKHDHDAVNEVNAGVFDGLAHYYADHYDPLFGVLNLTAPLDQLTTLQVVELWREDAWRKAEALVSARTPAELEAVQQRIEANSTMWAQLIRSVEFPGYRASRDAYCEAHRKSPRRH